MKACVLYARVSSARQEEQGFSIPAQIDLLTRYAKDHGFEIVETYTDIESAKQPGRTHFVQMLARLKKAPDLVVLVEKTDRLHRALRDYVEIDELIEHGTEIHFVKEGTILTKQSHSSERLVHGLKALIARNYILNLGEEAKKGMLKKAELGLYPSWAPFGFVNVGKGIAPDPERRDVIRRCFAWKAEGKSYREVSELAYDAGLRSRSGKRVPTSKVYDLLTNPVSYGCFRWRGKLFRGTHEPIVTKSEWDRAQVAKRSREQRHEFPFRGLLTCSNCGRLVTAELQKGRAYYHCAGRCGASWIREDRLQTVLAPVALAISIDADLAGLIRDALAETQVTKRREIDADRERLTRARKEVERRTETLWEDRIAGTVPEAVYVRLMAKMEGESVSLLEQEARLRDANKDFVAQGEEILELCERLGSEYVARSAGEQADLLRTLTSNIRTDGVSAVATYKKPFDVLAERPPREDWLGSRDSNPNTMVQSHVSCRWTTPQRMSPRILLGRRRASQEGFGARSRSSR